MLSLTQPTITLNNNTDGTTTITVPHLPIEAGVWNTALNLGATQRTITTNNSETYTFPTQQAALEFARTFYGWTPTPTNTTINIHTSITTCICTRNSIWIAGRQIAYRYNNTQPALIAPGVTFTPQLPTTEHTHTTWPQLSVNPTTELTLLGLPLEAIQALPPESYTIQPDTQLQQLENMKNILTDQISDLTHQLTTITDQINNLATQAPQQPDAGEPTLLQEDSAVRQRRKL